MLINVNVRKLVLVLIGISLNMSPFAFAQEESPASDEIIEVDEEGEIEPEADEEIDESWESYDDTYSEIDTITEGLRVESIVEPITEYHYASFGHGDPFIPPLMEEKLILETDVPLVSVLQKYGLQALSVVGIWQVEGGERKALIMSDDEGVVVIADDVIGMKGGRVYRIEPDSIVVREFLVSLDGTRQFEDTVMHLDENLSQETSRLAVDLDEEDKQRELYEKKASLVDKVIEKIRQADKDEVKKIEED